MAKMDVGAAGKQVQAGLLCAGSCAAAMFSGKSDRQGISQERNYSAVKAEQPTAADLGNLSPNAGGKRPGAGIEIE